MFESVRNNKRVVQVILGLITLSFAFFGIESYLRGSGGLGDVATVAGSPVSVQEFEQGFREQQERIRSSSPTPVDGELFKSAQFRGQVVNTLVNQRVLSLTAFKAGLTVSDRNLQEMILSAGAFQDGGQFSKARYEAYVRAQGLSEVQFEARLRQDMAFQQIAAAVGDKTVVARRSAAALVALQAEQRVVRTQEFKPDRYVPSVAVTAEDVERFYNENQSDFSIPRRLRAEYVVLNAASLESEVSISNEEIREWYDDHKEKYIAPEERRASHILIQTSASASEAESAKARALADDLLARVKADPSKFGSLAREFSQDPGSSAKEGDLGFIGRGVMVKPFEDAVFSLKEGEISGLVQSEFGLHIIRLTAIKPAQGKAFDAVRDEIQVELKRQAAAKRFAESAEAFGNMVYEQSDSLAPVAEQLKLHVVKSDWIDESARGIGEHESRKLIAALFSEDALVRKHNTEAIDVGNKTLVAARVLEHQPATVLSLEKATERIRTILVQKEASRLAKKAGEEALAAIKAGAGGSDQNWSKPLTLQRSTPGVEPQVVRAVFGADQGSLPLFVGVSMPAGGYALIKIESINKPAMDGEDPRIKAAQEQLARGLGRQDMEGYVRALRARYDVKINQTVLGKLAAEN
ncbi:MAG: SurA N-terminal domain-containing protein [Rhodocyclaceae bacterium]|jgi:peptidyl-prolyl cis-trans isomerase D|nr:SurA N-terminal domain-containing protein [Rhodocyclaceae bacterium]